MKLFPHQSCQSYKVRFPSQLWVLDSARVSSRLLRWTGLSGFGAPRDLEHWQPDAHRICRWGRCLSHCQSAEMLSSLWKGWGQEGGRCCLTLHLDVPITETDNVKTAPQRKRNGFAWITSCFLCHLSEYPRISFHALICLPILRSGLKLHNSTN